MCKTLRVLNAVRSLEIGVPLSIQQYKELTAAVLISRLINFEHHFLALRQSEYLGSNQELVIMHWACTKITGSLAMSDSDLLSILLDKLKLCKGIDYARVAEHADKSGRRKLAASLVEHEPCSSKQVPLLMSIGEEAALTKATESGDTDLVYFVLFHIWQKKSSLEFFGMIQAKAMANDLFIAYSRCYKHEFLKDLFLSAGEFQKNSLHTIRNIANVCCVQFSSHSSNMLAFGSSDYKIYCYDLRNAKVPWCILAGHEKAVSYVKFVDSEIIVSASTDNTLKVWDLNRSKHDGISHNACSLTLGGHTNDKNFVGLSVAVGYITCGSETNKSRLIQGR